MQPAQFSEGSAPVVRLPPGFGGNEPQRGPPETAQTLVRQLSNARLAQAEPTASSAARVVPPQALPPASSASPEFGPVVQLTRQQSIRVPVNRFQSVVARVVQENKNIARLPRVAQQPAPSPAQASLSASGAVAAAVESRPPGLASFRIPQAAAPSTVNVSPSPDTASPDTASPASRLRPSSAAIPYNRQRCPFLPSDEQVEGLFEIDSVNYAIYEGLRQCHPELARSFDTAVTRLMLQVLADVGGLVLDPLNIWTDVRPGLLGSAILRFRSSGHGGASDELPFLADAEWPLRIRVVVRCAPQDTPLIVSALQWIGQGRVEFAEPFDVFRQVTGRIVGPCTLFMVAHDAPESSVDGIRRNSPLRQRWNPVQQQSMPSAPRQLRTPALEDPRDEQNPGDLRSTWSTGSVSPARSASLTPMQRQAFVGPTLSSPSAYQEAWEGAGRSGASREGSAEVYRVIRTR